MIYNKKDWKAAMTIITIKQKKKKEYVQNIIIQIIVTHTSTL